MFVFDIKHATFNFNLIGIPTFDSESRDRDNIFNILIAIQKPAQPVFDVINITKQYCF